MHRCETCGAPVDPYRAACRYCGDAYPLDELTLRGPVQLSTHSSGSGLVTHASAELLAQGPEQDGTNV